MLRLHVLGTLQVEGDGPEPVDELLAQSKALALLVYLALARPRGFHQRDRLVGLFWPELDQERARAALRKLLSRLRALAGDEALVTRGAEAVALAPDALWCDAVAFERAVAEGRLGDALELHGGELAPGLHVAGAEAFERWLEEERARARESVVDVAWALVERHRAQKQFTNATRLARRVARLAPTDERMLRRVLTMLAQLDDNAGAVRVYADFAERLWRDLEVRPSPETRALVERIRRAGEEPPDAASRSA
jgi:serine/threonine-protein kinase